MAAFCFGRYKLKCEQNRDKLNRAEELHTKAYCQLQGKEYFWALEIILEAISIHPNPKSYSLLGYIYEKLQEDERALNAYDRACYYSSSHHEHLGFCSDSLSPYYYFRRSKVAMRLKEWYCAYSSADLGIMYIEDGDYPKDPDVYQELRVARMICALFHFKGSEAIEKAQVDQKWLQETSVNDSFLKMAQGINVAKTVTQSFEDYFKERNDTQLSEELKNQGE